MEWDCLSWWFFRLGAAAGEASKHEKELFLVVVRARERERTMSFPGSWFSRCFSFILFLMPVIFILFLSSFSSFVVIFDLGEGNKIKWEWWKGKRDKKASGCRSINEGTWRPV